ncbi:hypothetical protein BG011_001708 [Mortierella polycephala]|uniref:C3H1-type domain-containing protein n=1 Tax=Mortierella polycephala TaxID=41804 RepID=A0A9P6TV68_9FUNG|nr:hypothetical protein BG011_001708 [Mortierella polycephala]
MPPKKMTGEKKKLVEDKTFGLKNKNKSAKVARYVETVKNQAMHAGQSRKDMVEKEREKQAILDRKRAEQAKKEEISELFKPIQVQQKVPFGVNPKTILCAFHRAGTCTKGDRCKFSHDLNIERKTVKRDLYTDNRDDEKTNDTMDTWDQKKLESVVSSKAKGGITIATTDIVCKFFLEAIENQKYGWFWDCPNGGTQCKYRHALPPGFVLKTKAELRAEANKEEISIEDFLEKERHSLGKNLTPVTVETFAAWKKTRADRLEQEEQVKRKAKEAAFKAGKMLQFSGRELFDFNPEIAGADDEDDDDNIFDFSRYTRMDTDETPEEFEARLTRDMANVKVDDELFAGEEDVQVSDDDE